MLGEELGFIGVALALSLFLFLFLRVIRISERANDSFSSLVAFGLLASWFTHVLENVGMTLEPHADHRHSAAVLQLRRIVHARVLAVDRNPGAHLERRARRHARTTQGLRSTQNPTTLGPSRKPLAD